MTTPFDLPTPELERYLQRTRQKGSHRQRADALIAFLVRLVDYDTERTAVLLDELRAVASPDEADGDILYVELIQSLLDWESGLEDRAPIYKRVDEIVVRIKHTRNERLLGWGLYAQSTLSSLQGNLGTALLVALEAQEIFERVGDFFGLAGVYGLLGGCYRALGDTHRQLNATLLAWTCLRAYEAPTIEVLTLHNLVLSFLYADRIAEALDYITRALALLEQHSALFDGHLRGAMECRLTVMKAAAYLQQGDITNARTAIDHAQTLFLNRAVPGTGGRVWVRVAAVLSDIEFHEGNYAAAEVAALDSLDACEQADSENYKEQILSHRRLVAIYQQIGNFEAALRHSEKAYQLECKTTAQILAMEQIEARLQRTESGFPAEKETEFLQALLEGMMQRQAESRRQQQTDALTLVYNRYYLDDTLPGLLKNATRTHTPLSVCFCDIDNFKQINDTFLHVTGDAVLKVLGQILPDVYTEPCEVVRQGGEEFVVMAPGMDAETAATYAERLRHAISAYPWETIAPRLRVTVSIGVAQFAPHEDYAEQLLARADHAMYNAKRSGKNRVVVASSDHLRATGD